MITVKAQVNQENPVTVIPPRQGALLDFIKQHGQTPRISLSIFFLEDITNEIRLENFISYKFSSSIMTPVDAFQCEVSYQKIAGKRKPGEGDIFVLRANGTPVCTGIVDQLDMETDPSTGTRLSISGRNLLGQWEDQDAVSLDSKILYGTKYTVDQIVTALAQNSRINPGSLKKQTAPTMGYLAATQPGESKLSSMQRYCEALDIYFWTKGDGSLVVGRPDMYGLLGARKPNLGTFACLEAERQSNVLAMRSTRASTQIPNTLVPIWNGQESVQFVTGQQTFLDNNAEGPARLRTFGHRTPKAVVVSTPEGSAPQDLAEVNALLVAKQNVNVALGKAGASSILQAYAKRELARANVKEISVQCSVVGHYNDYAEPLQPDQVYHIRYDADDIDEDMYLHEVEYTMDIKTGPTSRLYFCRQKALVSDVRAI